MLRAVEATVFAREQLERWPEVAARYKALEQVQVRDFRMDGCTVRVQFNPQRIGSTTAQTDEKTVRDHSCFLCGSNRPAQQFGLPFGREYEVLVNPFPILPLHLTVPTREHIRQRIAGRIGDFMELVRQLEPFAVFYNGPRSGASVPAHFHFQVGGGAPLPVMQEYKKLTAEVILERSAATLSHIGSYLRPLFLISCTDQRQGIGLWDKLYAALPPGEKGEEPGMNLLGWYESGRWRLALFPRQRHRPSFYYREAPFRLLVSPGALDMAGLLITPREEDFNTITADHIRQIYREVGLQEQKITGVINRLKHNP